jgi:hypothetical protein
MEWTMAKDMDLPTPARRAVNFDDPYARALAIVQQEMVAMPRRKTSTAQERALNQTYRRCVERLAEDVTAQRLVRRYGLGGSSPRPRRVFLTPSDPVA